MKFDKAKVERGYYGNMTGKCLFCADFQAIRKDKSPSGALPHPENLFGGAVYLEGDSLSVKFNSLIFLPTPVGKNGFQKRIRLIL